MSAPEADEHAYLALPLGRGGAVVRLALMVGAVGWLYVGWLGWFSGDDTQFVVLLVALTTGSLAMMFRRHWTPDAPIVWVPRAVTAALFVVWLVLAASS